VDGNGNQKHPGSGGAVARLIGGGRAPRHRSQQRLSEARTDRHVKLRRGDRTLDRGLLRCHRCCGRWRCLRQHHTNALKESLVLKQAARSGQAAPAVGTIRSLLPPPRRPRDAPGRPAPAERHRPGAAPPRHTPRTPCFGSSRSHIIDRPGFALPPRRGATDDRRAVPPCRARFIPKDLAFS
jgi:hypothetical protein